MSVQKSIETNSHDAAFRWTGIMNQHAPSVPSRCPRPALTRVAIDAPPGPTMRRNEPETMADNEFRISEVSDGLVVTGVRLDKGVVTKAAGFVTSQAAGKWGMGRYTGARPTPTHDEIAQVAYRLYECRGRQDGNDIEDWLRAEQELVRHYA